MNRNNHFKIIVSKAINACINKNASDFASLFTEDGKIILKKDYEILKPNIEKTTSDYFETLEYINISVNSISIENNKALIKWLWKDFNLLTKEKNQHDNIISITFKSDLIYIWQEFDS